MKIEAYSILIILSVLVVLLYVFNYLAGKLKIPSVLLLIVSGIGLKNAADYFNFQLGIMMTIGLLVNKQSAQEEIQDV